MVAPVVNTSSINNTVFPATTASASKTPCILTNLSALRNIACGCVILTLPTAPPPYSIPNTSATTSANNAA